MIRIALWMVVLTGNDAGANRILGRRSARENGRDRRVEEAARSAAVARSHGQFMRSRDFGKYLEAEYAAARRMESLSTAVVSILYTGKIDVEMSRRDPKHCFVTLLWSWTLRSRPEGGPIRQFPVGFLYSIQEFSEIIYSTV